MTKIRIQLVALTLLVGLVSSGCLLSRTIVNVKDHPSRNVTLVETVDQYPFTTRHQFWNCVESTEDVTCRKICGGESKVACHEVTFGMTNLR